MRREFTLRLFGAFQLISPEGTDVTPRSSKSCALLALLALQDGHCLERRWIESQLWSESGQQQASASLRQSLTEIRKLTKDQGLLVTNRRQVSLDETKYNYCDCLTNPYALELLQGLDVRDSEFEAWLSVQRSQFDQRGLGKQGKIKRVIDTSSVSSDEPTTIVLKKSIKPVNTNGYVQSLLCQQISKNLLESGLECFELEYNKQIVSNPSCSFVLTIEISTSYTSQALIFSLHDAGTQRLRWSHLEEFKTCEDIEPLADLTRRLNISSIVTEQVIKAASTSIPIVTRQQQADALHAQAIKLLNSFEHTSMLKADRLLAEAQSLCPHSKHLAWRSFLRMVMYLERTPASYDKLLDESDLFVAQALEAGSDNALVLSLISQVQAQLNRDSAAAQSYAESALRINKGSAMAIDSGALFALHKGDHRSALAQSNLACNIGDISSLRHWWQMSRTLALIKQGDYQAAIFAAESCLVSAPNFRPPMRHLYPLYLKIGDVKTASLKLRQLHRLEPDFSMSMVRNNNQYPAKTIRESPLIELDDIAAN